MAEFGLRRWNDALKSFNEAIELLRIVPPDPNATADTAEGLHGFSPDSLPPVPLTIQLLEERHGSMAPRRRPIRHKTLVRRIVFVCRGDQSSGTD